jgi:hypothetical protein
MNTPSHYITELHAIMGNIEALEGETLERRARYGVDAHHKVKRMIAEVDANIADAYCQPHRLGEVGATWEHVTQRLYEVNTAIYRDLLDMVASEPVRERLNTKDFTNTPNIDRLIGRRYTPKESTMNFTTRFVHVLGGYVGQVLDSQGVCVWQSAIYKHSAKAEKVAEKRVRKVERDLFA